MFCSYYHAHDTHSAQLYADLIEHVNCLTYFPANISKAEMHPTIQMYHIDLVCPVWHYLQDLKKKSATVANFRA